MEGSFDIFARLHLFNICPTIKSDDPHILGLLAMSNECWRLRENLIFFIGPIVT
jgi:hypothetical protein